MKETETGKYKALLLAKRDDLMGKSRSREDIWISQAHDLIENSQLAGEREFAVRVLELDTRSLARIAAALERIQNGDFGLCLECEEPISPKRLGAAPWAEYCLHCQEMHDAEAADRFEPDMAA